MQAILPMIALPALLLLACGLSAAPLDEVRACAQRLPPPRPVAINLHQLCPGLDAALDALGLKPLLSAEERDHLDGTALRNLAELASRYDGRMPANGPPIAALAAIAEQVNGKHTETRTWWDRLSAWVREWLARPATGGRNWFEEWLHHLSESASWLNAILYASMAMVIAAALAIIIVELRAAGVLRRRQFSTGSQAGRDAGVAEIAGIPAGGRGAVPQLLQLLVTRLIQTRRLQFERALTHRELVARSVFDTPEQRGTFARVSAAAESDVYGGTHAAVPQPLVEQGNALLVQLTELPAQQPP